MRGLSRQIAISLRLHFRNVMALVYGYAFPLIFLVAFHVLYRYERVPLVRHMGELLTIAVLGGACFGLPTTMVSERERGVWRRYRLTPVPTSSLVVSTVAARYAILITAGLLQLGLAMALGMPMPDHPLELLVAFTFVSFAFLGLGLVIAMLADNVPAVQALGQCIFLPMLIIGGVAVRLSALPAWAQHLSAFFPGRYAVETIQATVNGPGLGSVRFSLAALVIIGAAGCLAAAKMFRWDSRQRFASIEGKGWIGVALGAWVAVGALAEFGGRIPILNPEPPVTEQAAVSQPAPAPLPEPELESESEPAAEPTATEPTAPEVPETVTDTPAPPEASPEPSPASNSAKPEAPAPSSPPQPDAPEPEGAAESPSQAVPAAEPAEPAGDSREPVPQIGPPTWQQVTMATIEADIVFDRLPPDNGVVTPVASLIAEPDPDTWMQLDQLSAALPEWEPGQVADPVQRVRNLLYVAAVPDVFQLPMESFVPLIVFARLEETVPREDLIKILYWIGVHPDEGDDSAVDELQELGIGNGPSDIVETRGRAAVYGVKLLGRLTGKRPGQ